MKIAGAFAALSLVAFGGEALAWDIQDLSSTPQRINEKIASKYADYTPSINRAKTLKASISFGCGSVFVVFQNTIGSSHTSTVVASSGPAVDYTSFRVAPDMMTAIAFGPNASKIIRMASTGNITVSASDPIAGTNTATFDVTGLAQTLKSIGCR